MGVPRREGTPLLSAAILENLADGIVATDRDLSITHFNRGAERIFGHPVEEVLGKPLDTVLPGLVPELSGPGRQEPGAGTAPGEPPSSTREVAGHRRDGTSFPAEVSISRLEVDGIPVYTACVRDLTGRRRREERRLRGRILEAVGRLAGGVAHNFNNLLTVIRATADLIQEDLGGAEPTRTRVGSIQVASDRAADLARQLVAVGRRQLLHPRVLELPAELASLEPRLRTLLGPAAELRVQLEGGVGRVVMDPFQLESLLCGLVARAWQAPPRRGRVTIEAHDLDLDPHQASSFDEVDPGSYVELVVTDEGPGLPADRLAHLFEPFASSLDAGSPELGLAVLYGMVKQSRGHLEAASGPGAGTSFRILLPRVAPGAVPGS